MDRWEHFCQAYDNWAAVQRDLAALGDGGWEAVSLVPVVLEARPVDTRMQFYLVMKRRVIEQPGGEWLRRHLVPDGAR